jgi:hypothetical protein
MTTKDPAANPHTANHQSVDSGKADPYKAQVSVQKEVVNLKPDEKGITIAELFSNKDKYAGKTVRIRGKVTKFNAAIMDKNWIHLQDGTESSGKFDLTATTDIEVAVGETITLEGKVAVGKDFGYGYSYEILLENAKIVK